MESNISWFGFFDFCFKKGVENVPCDSASFSRFLREQPGLLREYSELVRQAHEGQRIGA